MSTVVAIGETHEIEGFALAGVKVIDAATNATILDAWRKLDDDVGLVILSPMAAETLGRMLPDRPDTLTVVMP